MEKENVNNNTHISKYFYYLLCVDTLCKLPNTNIYHELKMNLVDEMFKIEKEGKLREIDQRFWDLEHELAEKITFKRLNGSIAESNFEFIFKYRDISIVVDPNFL